MVIVKLMGGLGNQMFQYAIGRRLAQDRGVPLKLDLSWFADRSVESADTVRRYELDGWRVEASIANAGDMAEFSIDKRVLARLGFGRSAVIRERRFGFEPAVLNAPGSVYLVGYWQSEKYFDSIRQVLLEDFTLAGSVCAHAVDLAERIAGQSSVAVHVRRGDYARNPRTNAFHGLCTPEYYAAAARLIAERVANPSFFVFSDDLDWASEHLELGGDTTLVEHEPACEPHQDIQLMSRCAHHIIANSSFSWWGAWLAANPRKIVVAPHAWFRDARQRTEDLIPEGWRRI